MMRWQLTLEKFRPDIIWLKSEHNQAVDTLSWLPYIRNDTAEHEYNLLGLAEMYGVKDIPDEAFPFTYKYLDKGQSSDQSLLMATNKEYTSYTSKTSVGGCQFYNLIVYKSKIVNL